jgi:hypothetical protein
MAEGATLFRPTFSARYRQSLVNPDRASVLSGLAERMKIMRTLEHLLNAAKSLAALLKAAYDIIELIERILRSLGLL